MAYFTSEKCITRTIFSTILGTNICGNDLVFTCDISHKDSLVLNLYDKSEKLLESIDLHEYRINDCLFSVTLINYCKDIYSYEYVADGQKVLDKYRKVTVDSYKWGEKLDNKKSGIYADDFDWESEKKPYLDFNKVVSYLMHVRGFSMQDNSVPKIKRGTFMGIVDKVDYLKDLGINQLILMPAYDFEEIIVHKEPTLMEEAKNQAFMNNNITINYWGYTKAAYFTPKNAFAVKNAINEYKTLVKCLHENGIEVIMQFYFPKETSVKQMLEVLSFWAINYHVDGFYLMGEAIPTKEIIDDSSLAGLKIYLAMHNAYCLMEKKSTKTKVAVYNNEFLNVARRLNKSDEDVLGDFVQQFKACPPGLFNINYITSNEGFTLRDLVSYDYKHNEDNGENNHDGTDYNFSWNCGVEGASKKKSVTSLRMRQQKNLLLMMLLSNGMPMLLAGDENLNSQCGNNNAYCQDNKIGYVDWKSNKETQEIYSFIKEAISFRRNHTILCTGSDYKMFDYKAVGYPDVSLHSEEAWHAKITPTCRHIGMMYCGDYSLNDNNEFIYIAFNLHWEKHQFAIPKLPKGRKWKLELYTGDEIEKKTISDSIEISDDNVEVPYRSIAVLKSVKDIIGKNIKKQEKINVTECKNINKANKC